ncbi:MAG TPA: hypothetical protein VGR66_05440 [Candidatus Eisenbacteria bacterium]|nr:hypothetical protein [Candidatus Eisenbacteria bacterium]
MKLVRRVLALLFAGSVAAWTAAGPASVPASAACECDIAASSPWFTLAWQDTCPSEAASDLERTLTTLQKQQLLQRMAHGVAVASQAWHLVQNNPDLRASLSGAPIALVRTPRGPLRRSGAAVPKPDSALARFRYADKSSVARLYTVRLGSYGSKQAAATALLKWKSAVQETAAGDSLTSITWRYQSCAGAREPSIFILPPSMSASGQYDLDVRLLIERTDAERLAKLLEPRLLTRTEVVSVVMTGSVLFTALAP